MKGRILVVDDDGDICRLVKLYLENEGFEVALTYSGEEALALLREGTSVRSGDPSALPWDAGGAPYIMTVRRRSATSRTMPKGARVDSFLSF